MYTNLLSRQLKRFLKSQTPVSQEWHDLLEAVNESYKHYEKDYALAQHSLDISSMEHQALIQKEQELQHQLTTTARQAGMSQVATSVLHNVGNVLNSLNISSTMLKELYQHSELHMLDKIAQLFKEHEGDLASFITEDPHGKHIPQFIIAITQVWHKEHAQCLHELESLVKNIEHISNIIKMHQAMSGVLGIKERASLSHVLDQVLKMFENECVLNKISIEKKFANLPDISLDQGRLFQIVMNLIRNAIDAMKENTTEPKRLIINTSLVDPQTVQIEVTDTGCGIQPQHQIKIFSYGFTTKKNGHGLGLHSSSYLAKEMGGKLEVKSPGVGKGASFILTLPFEVK